MGKLKTPIIIVNFKTYKEATGKNAEKLAKAIENASRKTGKNVAIAVQDTDIYRVSQNVFIPVLAEHVDNAGLGGFTGKTTFLAIEENGAEGMLINHSEDRIDKSIIEEIVKRCKNEKLTSIVCAKDSLEAKKLAVYSPDFIAVEPPELIGGDISVSTAKPEVITNTIDKVRSVDPKIKILCGAGVKTPEDVRIAIKLGAKGILLASGITKAKNPEKIMVELLEAL